MNIDNTVYSETPPPSSSTYHIVENQHFGVEETGREMLGPYVHCWARMYIVFIVLGD